MGEVEAEGELLMFKSGVEGKLVTLESSLTCVVMGIWLFDSNELQALHRLIISQRTAKTNTAIKKSIALTDLLPSTAVKNNNNSKKAESASLEERLRSEFAGHNFGDLKEFARAVARFITLDPSTVADLFEELRK